MLNDGFAMHIVRNLRNRRGGYSQNRHGVESPRNSEQLTFSHVRGKAHFPSCSIRVHKLLSKQLVADFKSPDRRLPRNDACNIKAQERSSEQSTKKPVTRTKKKLQDIH
jgi:hypothetical protein